MKIAIIRKKYTFHGGAEGFTRQLLGHLAAQGHEVHVFASGWEEPSGNENITFHRIPTLNLTSFLRDLTFAFSTCHALRGGGFDIVQSHDKTLCQDIYRAGDGCHIEWLRQRWRRTGALGRLSIAMNPYHWLILALERAILRGHRYKKVIAISGLVKRNLIENYGVPEADIEVIYNGVDTERFNPENRALHRAEVRLRHSIPEGETVALFVGSGFERKGVRYLLQALDLVDAPLTVLVVGRGRALPFRDLRGNKRVVFTGPRRDVQAYYAASDFFVFPTMYEPFGNVHLEALASGLPVVTTAMSGGAEIIEDGVDGFIVPLPEDTAGIARATAWLTDGARRAVMSANARRKAEAFTFSRHVEKTLELYNKMLGGK